MKLVNLWPNKAKRYITPPLVETKSGIVEGFFVQTKKGPVNVFLGIPYAEPPIGDLRFQKTEPVKPWEGVKKCKKYKSRAHQNDFFWDRLELRVKKDEDCLYLNVIAPSWRKDNEKESYPVLIYIHGGGYVFDSAVKYRYYDIARLLVVQDVVVVTIQYRLGYLGFFCTGDDNCKGNFGLWDQVTALQWIYDNIAFFGGDPNRITVAGQSAGGTSADVLSLSPYSRDLFQQLILMGGTAESSWATCEKEKIVEYCKKRVKKLGWTGTDTAELMKFLRTVPAQKLGDTMIGNHTMFTTATLPLGPVIDGDLLPRSIDELRKESKVKNTMIGVCEHEGLLFAALGHMNCDKKDIDFGINLISKAVKGKDIDVSAVVKDVYFKTDLSKMSRGAIKHTFVDMLDDVVSNFACSLYAKKVSLRGANVYMYTFEHFNPSSFGLLNFLMPFKGATHGTELLYLFNSNIFVAPFRKNAKDRKVTEIMTKLCMNFVKNGDPNLISDGTHDDLLKFIWEPLNKNGEDCYLKIAPECELKKEFKNGRLEELQKIFGNSKLSL